MATQPTIVSGTAALFSTTAGAGHTSYENTYDSGATGNNRLTAVFITADSATGNGVDSVTYDDVELTEVEQELAAYPGPWIVGGSLWILKDPPTGENQLVVNYSGSGTDKRQVLVFTLQDCNQSAPINASFADSSEVMPTGSGTQEFDTGLTTTVDDCFVMAMLVSGGVTAWSPTAPATEHFDSLVTYLAATILSIAGGAAGAKTLASTATYNISGTDGEQLTEIAVAFAPVTGSTVEFSGTGETETDGDAALSATRALSGDGASETAGAGGLAVSRALSGAGASQTDGAGVLGVARPMTGLGAAGVDGFGSLSVSRAFSGAGQSATAGQAALAVSRSFGGIGGSETAGGGLLAVLRALAGLGATETDGGGELDIAGSVALAGVGASLVGGFGSLSVTRALSGAGATEVDGSGELDADQAGAVALSGTGASLVGGFGALSVTRALAGVGATESAGFGDLIVATPAADEPTVSLLGDARETIALTGHPGESINLTGQTRETINLEGVKT